MNGQIRNQQSKKKLSVLETWPKVAIIILNWNGWRDTIECLESVQNLNYSNYQIILLDNGSTNDSVEKIKEWCGGNIPVNTNFVTFSPELKPVKYIEYDRLTAEAAGVANKELIIDNYPSNRRMVFIQIEENLGFAEGNNVAIEYALNCYPPAEFVFLLNNDAWIDVNCIASSVEVSKKKKAAVVGCVVKDKDRKEILFSGDCRRPELFYLRKLYTHHDLMVDEPSSMVCGCAMLVNRNALIDHKNRYGYFLNPKLFLYGEETEFCLNIKRLGHEIYVSKKAIVYHKEAQSSGKQLQNSLPLYYMTRNTIFIANNFLSCFWRIFFQIHYPFARLRVIIRKLIEGKPNEAIAIFEGLLDGYKVVYGKWRKHG